MPAKVKEDDKKKIFLLSELPNYDYTSGLACRACYVPLPQGRKEGRCDDCLKSKDVLPVNYRRPPKRKDDEEDEEYA